MHVPQNPLIIERRIAFSQTDAAGLAHFTTYFTLMEEAEAELFRTLGIALIESAGGALSGYPRVECQCRFSKPLRFDDQVRVELSIQKIGANRIHYNILFYDPGCEPCAEGRMVTAFVTGQQGADPRAVPMPETAREALENWKNQAT